MDDARFDAWTRRRVGCAAGGAVAALLGLGGGPVAAKRKRKKKRCRKLLRGCRPGKAPRCCKGSVCGTSQISGSHCCTPNDRPCSFSLERDECCPGFFCSQAAGVCIPLE
jgi:hypothetical protein